MKPARSNIPFHLKNKWAMVISVAAGFLFPFISITIIALRSDAFLTIKSVAQIHKIHPELYPLYLLPLLFQPIFLL